MDKLNHLRLTGGKKLRKFRYKMMKMRLLLYNITVILLVKFRIPKVQIRFFINVNTKQ